MTLRDAILKNLDAAIWRSCGDISQRINANSIDVGCALKKLVDTEKLVERRTDKCDNPINFRYRIAPQKCLSKSALDTSLPKAMRKLAPAPVTEDMRREAAEYIQKMQQMFKPYAIEELVGITPAVQARIASMSHMPGGGYAATDGAIKIVLKHKQQAQGK